MRRWSPEEPCPVCGGNQKAPRGRGERCTGYLSSDGGVAFCSRDEHAGALPVTDSNPPTYAHRLAGDCPCGRRHGGGVATAERPRPRRRGGPRGRVDQVYLYVREDGKTPAFRVLRFEPKDFLPQHQNGTGDWVAGLNGVVKVPYRLPELLAADRDDFVYVGEGEKVVERLRREGLTATTTHGGAGQRRQWREQTIRDWFRARHVVILPDDDDDGVLYAQEAAEQLWGIAKTIRVVPLPGLEPHEDAVEWFNLRGGTVATLRHLVDGAPPWEPGTPIGEGGDGRREVDGGEPDLMKVRPAAWAALRAANDPPRLFRQSGLLVRVAHGEDGAPVVQELTPDRMRNELADAARWYENKPDKWGRPRKEYTRPPFDVVRAVLAETEPDLPVLDRVVETPVFGPDGELRLEAGYHAPSRTYYEPRAGFALPPVAERPEGTEVARARGLIVDELLGDFPFVTEADRAHAVAALLLPFARDLVDGPTPGHMIEAPTQGSGKGLLADVLVIPSIGGRVAKVTAETDEAEWKKALLAVFLKAPSVVIIDNVSRPLTSDTLAAAMTSESYEGRKLGSNETLRVRVRTVWIATANNPVMNRDMARRFVPIRIDPQTDHPELRPAEEFKHPNLRLWARRHRGHLVWACLTLIRAWLAGGRPVPASPTMGSFEHWAQVLGGVLRVAGVAGFLSNLLEFMHRSDREGNLWRAFVASWWAKHRQNPVTSGQLFELAEATEGLEIRGHSDRARATSFGALLAGQRDRVYTVPQDADDEDGPSVALKIVAPRRKVHGAQVWQLEPPGGGGLFSTGNPTGPAEPPGMLTNVFPPTDCSEVPQVPQVPLFGGRRSPPGPGPISDDPAEKGEPGEPGEPHGNSSLMKKTGAPSQEAGF